jgi:hypothetical protein
MKRSASLFNHVVDEQKRSVCVPTCAILFLMLYKRGLCSYEATSSRRNRSLAKELTTGAIASLFLVRFVMFVTPPSPSDLLLLILVHCSNLISDVAGAGFWVLVPATCFWCLCLSWSILNQNYVKQDWLHMMRCLTLLI